MSWPKDPFVTDGAYKTPLPYRACERDVWRVVARLYEYATLAALFKLEDAAVPASSPPSPPSKSDDRVTAAPKNNNNNSITSSASRSGSSASRAQVVERRSAFLAVTAHTASPASPTSDASPSTVSPLNVRLTRRPQPDTPGAGASTGSSASPSEGEPASPRLMTAPPTTTARSQSNAPRPFRRSSSRGNSDANNSGGTTSGTRYLRAAALRALEPLQNLLSNFASKQWTINAGVVDVAVQHPLPCLRVELVRLLLTYPLWDWSMCAPVAVAAGRGDVGILKLLLEVKELDPNTGFPLAVAVRLHHEEAVLPVLLAHHRIRPNYGGAFYVAVTLGNVKAMCILGDTAGVNVNRSANNEGTSALLYALRQYCFCRRRELQQPTGQREAPSPSSMPLLHASRVHKPVSSPTQITLDEMKEKKTTTSPLLKVHMRDSSNNNSFNLAELNARGRTSSREPEGTKRFFSSSVNRPLDSKRGNPLYGSRSPEVALEEGAAGIEEATKEDEVEDDAAAQRHGKCLRELSNATAVLHGVEEVATMESSDVSLSLGDAHSGPLRDDAKERAPQTTQHWREVLLYLLNHPAIEINAGFHMTPLQICVLADNAEVVSWLLQHPHLHPCRLLKSTITFRNSYYMLQHHALSPSAMRCVVATPIEMASQLRHLDIFRLLARDKRVHVPVRLSMDLERSAADSEALPFLTVLAQYREEWEGWGWRWRRRCLMVAATSTVVFALCFWVMAILWRSKLRNCLLVFTGTYAVSAFLSVLLYLWEAHGLRNAAGTSLTQGTATLLALVRHLYPAWPSLRQRMAVVVLLVFPAMLPLLDVLCAWCILTVHRSRRRLETAECSGTSANDVAALASSHSATPTSSAMESIQAGGPPPARHHHHYPRRHPHAEDQPFATERLSSTVSWRWSFDVFNVSAYSIDNSFSGVSPGASIGGGYSHAVNESFSCPHPAMARNRRQYARCGSGTAGVSANHMAQAGATAQAAGSRPRSMSSPASGCRGQFSFSMASSTGGAASSMASPTTCVSRNRGRWVLPGRPSRYTRATEYHAPDLLLRALAYTVYDGVATLPRLVACVVGNFLFMYMVFPTAAPSPSSSSSVHAVAGAVRDHSSLTLYYGAAAPPTTLSQPIAYNSAGVTTGTVAPASTPELPSYTVAIGLVGLCGLVASVLGGGALLGMMCSLRTVTARAFFVSPSDNADVKVEISRGVPGGRRGGDTNWQTARRRARDTQPDYML